MKDFELSVDQLKETADSLRERILEGLTQNGQEIKCLPTYLSVPKGEQCGQALVMDTGGTNMRAALVALQPRNGQINSGPVSAKVRGGREGHPVAGSDFFKEQAQLTSGLDLPQKTLPLGYCFSYPAECQPDGDAVLLRWTKGINITGVAGKTVGRPLVDALAELGVSTKGLSVLNDTVASLLGGAHLYADPKYGHNYIGLILGTGTNMAGVFTADQLKKVESDEPMVVNLESGNFCPPHLTKYDEGVDKESIYSGRQRFEKAISGHYLPYIFEQVRPGVFDPSEGTGVLVRMRDNNEEHAAVAAALLRRSARLAAAGLAAVASFYPADQPTAILGEGTLMWGDPQYASTMEQTLEELMPDRDLQLVRQRDNVNLLGAASAALSLLERSEA
jgi:hexokinase